MVSKVVGYVEGQELLFLPYQQNEWRAFVPAVPTGQYVIALYAYDEAGNSSFFATALFTVDLEKLIYKIEFIQYTNAASVLFGFGAEKINAFTFDSSMKEYRVEVVETGENR